MTTQYVEFKILYVLHKSWIDYTLNMKAFKIFRILEQNASIFRFHYNTEIASILVSLKKIIAYKWMFILNV